LQVDDLRIDLKMVAGHWLPDLVVNWNSWTGLLAPGNY